MSVLNLAGLSIDLKAFNRWMVNRGMADDEGRALHHLLAELFGKSILQPFRMMVAPGARNGTLYAYTHADRETLLQTARETGMPDMLAVCDMESLAVKTMPETWREGRRLAFDVRVRPVKRLRIPAGKFSAGAEVDAFLLEVLRRFPDGPPADERVDRTSVYVAWLTERLLGIADLAQAQITCTARSVALRRSATQHKESRLQGPDVTFHGELIVSDTAKFQQCLVHGIGRHTAYGYGMMLLRPAR